MAELPEADVQLTRRAPGSTLVTTSWHWGTRVNPASVSRRLVAVFAADVEGYSRLMGADEVGTLKGLTERRAILDRFIGEHRGRIANTAGDSVLAEFGSAVDAVQCAVEGQAALAEANTGVPPDKCVHFRIGVHIGDVMVRAGDLFGDGVNIAARLQTLAKPGTVCISGATYDQVRKVLPMTFVDLGVSTGEEHSGADQGLSGGVRRVKRGEAANTSVVEAGREPPLPDKPSIAVSPFQNMSGDPEQEYFADGLCGGHHHRAVALSRVRRNRPQLDLLLQGQAARRVAGRRDLRVRYVLEGSVRKVGNRVRVTAQLIDALTNEHIWAERYDREQADVFALQEEITRTVVASIAPEIDLAEIARSRRDTTSLHAWQLAMRAAGLYLEAFNGGNAVLMQQAIFRLRGGDCRGPRITHSPPHARWGALTCHLFRWGDRPDEALDRAWAGSRAYDGNQLPG